MFFFSISLSLKCSPQRDYVILAVRTPPKEEQNETYCPTKLTDIDEEWVTTHASQVAQFHNFK